MVCMIVGVRLSGFWGLFSMFVVVELSLCFFFMSLCFAGFSGPFRATLILLSDVFFVGFFFWVGNYCFFRLMEDIDCIWVVLVFAFALSGFFVVLLCCGLCC